jgi:hypothetical protein
LNPKPHLKAPIDQKEFIFQIASVLLEKIKLKKEKIIAQSGELT